MQQAQKWIPDLDQYEFLQSDSNITRQFDELPSDVVSELVEQGVLLFDENSVYEQGDVPDALHRVVRREVPLGQPPTSTPGSHSQIAMEYAHASGSGEIKEARQLGRANDGDVDEAAAVEVLV